jgi:chemotaxis protein methyltransferase CheR
MDSIQIKKTIPDMSPHQNGKLELTEDEFRTIRSIVYENFGIHLTEQKRSLIIGRLSTVLKSYGCKTFLDYLNIIKSDKTGRLMGELIDRISTNHTFFFREMEHFDFFKNIVLPEIEARNQKQAIKDLRTWCPGCSYGDEPYTYMIVMMEYFGLNYGLWNAGLLATDISESVLSEARLGIYSSERIRLVPKELRLKYFNRIHNNNWIISEKIRNEITFRRLNLMNPSFPFKNTFDVISCRNVMIYFDQKTRNELIEKLYRLTTPGGYLFIGHSETLRSDSCPFEYVQPAIYKKRAN